MNLKDKLQMLMARQSLNGQKLARMSQVSDSEISRILQGKSRPGLDNAFRLARAVGVPLDYLADDAADTEVVESGDSVTTEQRKILTLAQKIGGPEVVTLLEMIRFLGYETAMSRLIGAKPIIEFDAEVPELRNSIPSVVTTGQPVAGRTNSALG
jgi:transcriptional regulator with XRE-family HTH domain